MDNIDIERYNYCLEGFKIKMGGIPLIVDSTMYKMLIELGIKADLLHESKPIPYGK